jgi:Ca2+-binding RTX toxin-like protein
MPTINGTAGNDTLDGTGEADIINGLEGHDTLNGEGGDDTLNGAAGDDNLNGGAGDDLLDGGTGANWLDGGEGDDELILGTSSDPFARPSLAWGGTGADVITGGDGFDDLYSDQWQDPEEGYSSFNPYFPEFYHLPTLDRGVEVDQISAGAGDDFVSIGYGDSADGGTNEGWSVGDILFLSLAASPTGLTVDFRDTTLIIGGGTITGFEAVNYVEGSEYSDVFTFSSSPFPLYPDFGGPSGGGTEISALGGDDQVIAGYYTNNIWGGDGNDLLNGAASQYLMYLDGGAGNDTLVGSNWSGAQLQGGAGNDLLDGGSAIDQLLGGAGDDAYVVDNAGDLITELSGEGTDEVRSAVNYQLTAYVENLVLTGSAVQGIGNSLNNHISGNAGDNIIKGGRGSDTFEGGAGNDTYYVSGTVHMAGDGGYSFGELDQVVENAGEGTDSVISNVSYTLGANVENLRLLGEEDLSGFGNGGDNRITGNDGDNFLQGLDGDDWLDGGAGADFLIGGDGSDTYVIDSQFDTIAPESPEEAGGIDTVRSGIDYALEFSLEHLTLIGAAVYGKGNHRDNNIIGNANGNWLVGDGGNDRLDGAAGDDQLDGGFGDDLILGRDGSDVVDGGAGKDRIYGDAGNDQISGGFDADVMYGGAGNDQFTVDNSGDVIVERAGEGTDSVIASASHVLKANVENLTLTGSLDLRGWGNDLANQIVGNAGSNNLYGYAGNDTIDGGAGADALRGGSGNDALDGGAGRDRFYGEEGADSFNFTDGDLAGLTSSTADQIHDFSQLQGDKIGLSGIDANGNAAGDQAFAFIGSGAFTGVAGQLRYQQISGNTHVMGDVDGDGTADFWIRLDGLHTLQGSDFII